MRPKAAARRFPVYSSPPHYSPLTQPLLYWNHVEHRVSVAFAVVLCPVTRDRWLSGRRLLVGEPAAAVAECPLEDHIDRASAQDRAVQGHH